MTSIVQEQQNQKILNFAELNFSSQTHEYGRHDMSGRLANKKTGERIDGSRFNIDADKDGRKGVDCSSLVYYSLEGAGFNLQIKPNDFSTRTLFEGKHLTAYAKQNFDFLPSASKNDGSLKTGDLLLMTMPGGAQHIAIFKEYDEKGRIHFFGSQTSTGPAEVTLTGNSYWDKKTIFHGALRAKEDFIKPEFRLKEEELNKSINKPLEQIEPNKPTTQAQDMINKLLAAYTSGDKDALSSIVANHAYTHQRNQEVAEQVQQLKEAEQARAAEQLVEAQQAEQQRHRMVRS